MGTYITKYWEIQKKRLEKVKKKIKNTENTQEKIILKREKAKLNFLVNDIPPGYPAYPVYQEARDIILKAPYLFNSLVKLLEYKPKDPSNPEELAIALLTQSDLPIDPVYFLELAFCDQFNHCNGFVFFHPVASTLFKIIGTAYLTICFGDDYDAKIRKKAKDVFLNLWRSNVPNFVGKASVWFPNYEVEKLDQYVSEISKKQKKLKGIKDIKEKLFEETGKKMYNKLSIKSSTGIPMISRWMVEEENRRLSLKKRIIKLLEEIRNIEKDTKSFDYFDPKNDYAKTIRRLINNYMKRYVEGKAKRRDNILPYWIYMPKKEQEFERFYTGIEYFIRKIEPEKIELSEEELLREGKYWLRMFLNRFIEYDPIAKQFKST